MKNISYLLIFLSLVACQIEDKDAPSPSESYIKYFGEANTSYEMVDIEVIYDDVDETIINSIIMLGTRQQEDARKDIYLVKTDASGIFVADTAYSFDNNSEDVACHIGRAGNNILVVGNTTTSPESGSLNGVIWNEFTTDLTPLSQPHPDTTLYSIFTNPADPKRISANDIIQTNDGNYVMVGNYVTQANDQQYYRLKIDATQKGNIRYPSNASNSDAALMWFVYGGVGASDDLVRVFEETNGDLVFVGNSSFTDGENGGINTLVVNANSTGNTNNSRSYGFNPNENSPIEASDIMADAIAKQGGYAIVGTSTQGNLSQAFFIDTGSGATTLLTSSFTLNDVGIKTNALGITQGSKNDYVIVGSYPDFRIDTNKGQQNKGAEAMVYRTDQFGLPIAGLETNYGLISGNDKAVVAKTLPDGKILIGATIDFGSGSTLMSLIKLNDTGQLDD